VTLTLPRPANVPGAAPLLPVAFTYDAAGNRTSATWSGSTVVWGHDALDRVVSVTLDGQPVTAHRYDPLGRRTETDRGRVANDPAAPANDQPLLTSRYGYDLADQLTDLAHNWVGGGLTAGYTYTANGELESESVSDPAFLWTPPPAQPRSLTYGPADPINALSTVNGIAQAHDGRGNRTRAGPRSFGYDSRNMLVSATLPGVQASYGTWPEGGRAWKQVNGTTTLYLEIDGVEWGEYDQSGNLRRRTIRASGTGGAAIATADPTNRLTWHLPNRQGSVIGWAGPVGKLQGKLTYDAYGNSPQAAAPGPAFRYAGMRYDPETGLYLTPNRSYDPQDGRWLQLDPIGVKDGLNRYAYVKNSPTNAVDISGLTTWFFGGAGNEDGAEYKQDMQRAFETAGISEVSLVPEASTSSGFLLDATTGVMSMNNLIPVNYSTTGYDGVKPGSGQYNLVGYSFGAVQAAQQALSDSARGSKVDNLVLIGAPINNDLLEAVSNNLNINAVHLINLVQQGDPISPPMTDFEIGLSAPILGMQMILGSGHFFYSVTGEEGKKRRDNLAQELYKRGLR
jgi:RHS repeat-associated protein